MRAKTSNDLTPAASGPDLWMTVRSFAHPQAYTTVEHAHPDGQLVAVSHGLVWVETATQRILVPANCAVWIPPGQLHGYCAAGPHGGWSTYIERTRAMELVGHGCVIALSALLREALKRAAAWPPEQALTSVQQHLAAVIIHEIRTLQPQAYVLPWPSSQALRKIASAFVAAPSDERTLPEWSAWAGIAPRTLTRRFAVETGLSFSHWRRRARLLSAMTMLSAGRSVTTVALELGYESLSAFSAMFRQALGISPSTYLAQRDPVAGRVA